MVEIVGGRQFYEIRTKCHEHAESVVTLEMIASTGVHRQDPHKCADDGQMNKRTRK